jgi:hypothetical protein
MQFEHVRRLNYNVSMRTWKKAMHHAEKKGVGAVVDSPKRPPSKSLAPDSAKAIVTAIQEQQRHKLLTSLHAMGRQRWAWSQVILGPRQERPHLQFTSLRQMRRHPQSWKPQSWSMVLKKQTQILVLSGNMLRQPLST